MRDRKKFNIITTSLVKARIPRKLYLPLLSVRDQIDTYLKDSELLYEALPFEKIVLSIRYGLNNDTKPDYQKINKKYDDLPAYIEVNMHEFLKAKDDENALYTLIYRPCLITLIDIVKKYKLNDSHFEKELEKLTQNMESEY